MFNHLDLIFGAFVLDGKRFLVITLFNIFLYAVILMLIGHYHPEEIDEEKEWIIFLCYPLVALSFSLVSAEISHLRKYLKYKNDALEVALKKIEMLSITDELTGIKNRRYMLETLEHQKQIAIRESYHFSVAMLDIDHFKNINDTYGHKVGDRVLKAIAESISYEIRKIDYFARWGGEEFLLILAFTEPDKASITAERLRIVIEEKNFEDIIPGLKLTLSMGITSYQRGETIDETLGRADAALYEAKRHGRNKVVTN
jgi:diguanylate cyclase (GGDEF)-like protein